MTVPGVRLVFLVVENGPMCIVIGVNTQVIHIGPAQAHRDVLNGEFSGKGNQEGAGDRKGNRNDLLASERLLQEE